METDDIATFTDEATSLARKEMMGLFVSAYDEKNKRVVAEFVSIATVSSTPSAILMDKVRNILSDNNIDIFKTCFPYLDDTNAMSGEHTGLQRRIRYFPPFSIYVNCRLVLCFRHLFELFPWLESLDKLLLGQDLYYSGKNHHILKELQEAYSLKASNLVKAAVTRWLSHGAAYRRYKERYVIIIETLDDIVSKNWDPDLLVHRNTLLETQIVFQITFLEGVLSVTNALSFLLQFDVEDFAAISCIVSSTLQILEDIDNDFNSIHLKIFSWNNWKNRVLRKMKYCLIWYPY